MDGCADVNPNPKKKHRPKNGPMPRFGTEAWTETHTMFRSIPKQCFGINYSMRHRIVKKRGHRISKKSAGIDSDVISDVNSDVTTAGAVVWLTLTLT